MALTLTYTHPALLHIIAALRVGMDTPPHSTWTDTQVAEHFHLPSDHQLLNGAWQPVPETDYDTHQIPEHLTSECPVLWDADPDGPEFMYVLGYESEGMSPAFCFRFFIPT